MTPALLVRRAADYLERHGVDNPRITAELLLASVLEVDRSTLATRTEGPTPQQARAFGRALCLRCAGTPTQHLTGVEGFRRVMLTVRPGVFIPRPETELLVELVLDAIRDRPRSGGRRRRHGDGRHRARRRRRAPGRPGVRRRRSPALPWRSRGRTPRRSGSRSRCSTVISSRRSRPRLRGVVDVVVSNPPYVRPEEVASLPAEVLADPETALVGGIELVERLSAEAMTWLRPGGTLARRDR